MILYEIQAVCNAKPSTWLAATLVSRNHDRLKNLTLFLDMKMNSSLWVQILPKSFMATAHISIQDEKNLIIGYYEPLSATNSQNIN